MCLLPTSERRKIEKKIIKVKMNRQIFLCCISSILVIHSIDYESAGRNITNLEDIEDEYEKTSGGSDDDYELNGEESPEREGRFFFNRRPVRFRRPLLSPRIASLFAAIPTLFGREIFVSIIKCCELFF